MTVPTMPTLLARGLLGLALAAAAYAPASAAPDTPTLNADEQAFVAKATADNSMQIALAQVAQARSTSPKVRALARRIIDDHRALNRKFTEVTVAKKARGRAHGLPSRDVTDDKLRLQNLRGEALDQTFAGMMVKEHQKIIPLYERAAKDLRNPQLQRIARDGLPLLREHLRLAQALTSR